MRSELATPILDAHIAGAVNLRDLGGHLTRDGRRVRTGVIYRSGMTHHIAPAGLARLAGELGLRTVIDLRGPVELEKDGLLDWEPAGVRHVHVPVLAITALTPDERKLRMRAFLDGTLSWADSYQRIAENCQESVRTFFSELASPGTFAVLFHCAAGRDRTGVKAALLLSVLGVDRKGIAEEYDLSGPALQPHVARFGRNMSELSMTEDEFGRVLRTTPAHILEFLDYLDATYGGAEGYLAAAGVEVGTVPALRDSLLVLDGDGKG